MNVHDNTNHDRNIIEELVAYLDGEVDEATRERIERRLAADSEHRQILEELRASWELLSDLPTAEPNKLFARSTVEMVAISAEQDLQLFRGQLKRRRGWNYGLALVGTGLAAVLGFAIVRTAIPDPDAELLRDLSVIENLDTYVYADNIDFVKKLYREGLFVGETGDEH